MGKYINMVALFSKALTMDLNEAPEAVDPQVRQWTVLGYFDFLQIYPLKESNPFWLSDVMEHNQSLSASLDGRFYFHPLHLTIGTQDEVACESFWEEGDSLPFLFLTLVQETELGSSERVRWNLMNGGADSRVKRICYHTMELSDLVVIWRSDSLYEMFQEIHALYQMPEVGDISTFCAIDPEYIRQFKDQSQMLSVDPGKKVFVSARYVVRDEREAGAYLQDLSNMGVDTEHVYFTTGMEDLHMLQERIEVGQFLHLLYAHLANERRQAFFECSTRLGIHEGLPSASNGRDGASQGSKGPNADFTRMCKDLLLHFNKIREKKRKALTLNELSWMRPASNLLNALTDMSKNWVMDGFCYLIYDAARMFCEKIDDWSRRGVPMKVKEETEPVQKFVRGWGSLMEQTTRTDGRFIQMPGFSPALCEISARLLECYLSVMMRCSDLMLEETDTDMDTKVALLLAPKICPRMKVIAVLEKPRDRQHLLYVDIPMEMMYEPTTALCCLCHELAHYVGESCRHRKGRADRMIYSAAYELAEVLNLKSPKVIAAIYEELRALCDVEGYQVDHAEKLSKNLQAAIKSAVYDDGTFIRWFELYLQEDTSDGIRVRSKQLEASQIRDNTLHERLVRFDSLENLLYLYRECYADITMIYLLKPTEETYRKIAAQEVQAWETADICKPGEQYNTLVARWALVTCVAYEKGLWEKKESVTAPKTNAVGEFYEAIDRFIPWFMQKGGEDIGQRSKETLQQIFDYLIECYDSIEKSFGGIAPRSGQEVERKAKLDELREFFSNLSCQYNIDYAACERFIMQYRKSVLNTPA